MEKDSVGDRIRSLRIAMNLSLPKLAEIANVSKGYLYQLETGAASSPSAEILYRIANALDTTVGRLLDESRKKDERKLAPKKIPEHLKEFISELRSSGEEISVEDIQMLASIKFRGKKPDKKEDWRFIYEAIKRSTGKE